MSPTIQSGMHPDAESLSAFAEQSLVGAEREQILAHMAACSRCREVVFLAQRAIDAEQSSSAPVPSLDEGRKSRGWSGGWWPVWVPTAAFAALVGLAALMHVRHPAQEKQMAGLENRADSIARATAGNTANLPAMQQALRQDESKGASALRESAAPKMQKDERVLDKRKSNESTDQRMQAADGMGAGFGAAVSGALESRAKSSPIGGPMAQNQLQQNYAQQNASVQPQSAPKDETSNKPQSAALSSSLARAGSVSKSVEVQSALQAVPSPSPATEMNLDVAGEKKKPAGSRVILPSGLEASSVATVGPRSIAIDASGALFLSEDAGAHWQSVKTQWTGRAVLVRALETDSDSALLKQQAPAFELVSDKLQSWVSADGKIWTEKNLPVKSPDR